jgi:hypothetical protein
VVGIVVVDVEEVMIVVVVAVMVVVASAELVGPSFEVLQADASRAIASSAVRFTAVPSIMPSPRHHPNPNRLGSIEPLDLSQCR